MILVEEATVKGTEDPSKVTEVAPVKFVPVMVTGVPPAMDPPLGDRLLMVGRAGMIVPQISTASRTMYSLERLLLFRTRSMW